MPKPEAELEWGMLQSFLAVVRAGRLTLAARRLGLDHSTLSRRIVALERSLQTQLFNRSATGYVLTEAGERLMRHAQEIETVALRIHTELSGSNLRVSGTVRIGAPDGFGTFFLAPVLGDLCALHQGMDVQLVALPRVFSLSKREADLAIGLVRPEDGRLHTRKLTDYELGLYASADYLDAHPAPSDMSALTMHRLIGYISDLIYARELDYLPLLSGNLHPGFTSSNLVAQFAATRAGHGLCVLPCFIADPEPGLRRVLAREVALRRSFWLTVHADMRNLTRVSIAADFIAEKVRSARPRFLP